MVRKRSRTATSRRKTYHSDDDDLESDLEVSSSSPAASPEPKRYGLRQRTKKTIFFEDFDDYEEPQKSKSDSSEDDEYLIEEDLKSLKTVNHKSRKSRLKITPRRKSIQLSMENDSAVENVTVSVSAIQPIIENDPDQNLSDGLIDYEDMIRADVVVNKKLDDEVLVGKSQQEIRKSDASNLDKGRRGRKPKKLLPPTPSTRDDDEANLEVQIDPLHFVRTETKKTNGILSPGRHRKKTQNGSPKSKIKLAPSILEGIEKFVPPNLDDKEKEVVLSNEYLLGNSFDMTADQFLERQASKSEAPEEEEVSNLPPINFDESSSDDDVVIIEKKPEIIVLDDD